MRPLEVIEFVRQMNTVAATVGEDNIDALKECDEILRAGVEENFEASKTARGEAWPARKPNPREKQPGHPLLILDGQLQAAATTDVGEIADGKTLIRRMPSGATGTSLAGIRRHEFGDEEIMGKEGILARPYYGVSEEAADACAEKVADSLVEQVMQALS